MHKHALAALSLASALLGGPAAPASAGPLAPARASDLVTLINKNVPCPVNGLAFDTRILPDGSEELFAIPPKRVLVVTSLDFVLTTNAPQGSAGEAVVSLQNGGVNYPLLVGPATVGANGTAVGTVVAPTGVTVKPGPSLCLIGGGVPAGVLHGYLAKDK